MLYNFFMFNSIEHEISMAHKAKMLKNKIIVLAFIHNQIFLIILQINENNCCILTL